LRFAAEGLNCGAALRHTGRQEARSGLPQASFHPNGESNLLRLPKQPDVCRSRREPEPVGARRIGDML
jgi:hypothetical protein